MYTKCPECHAIFRITTEQLDIADGLVRCGLCDSVFNGKDHLHEDYGQSTTPTPSDLENQEEPYEENLSATDTTADYYDQQDDDETLISADKVPTVIRDDFGGGILSKPSNPLQIGIWTVGSITLAIFFLGQITYWQNVDVLPQSWVNNFCAVVGCKSDKVQDLSAIKILNRNIYTHPNVENALMITLSFVSESEISQPFPLLEIALLNIQGEIVAIRRFSPEDYLVNKSLASTLMQFNQPVGARLEVFDPGNTVITYEIEFY